MSTAAPSIDQLYAFVKSLDGGTLSTLKRGLSFDVEVVGDALVYVPSATGRTRPQPRSRTQMCLELFERTGSFNTRDYQKITANASYFLATLDAYLNRR